ncbi:MAG: hypothetical protein U1D30_21080 [Planctomycetota bacterium]
MSSVGSVGAANSQIFALIDRLNDVVADGTKAQTDLATKITKLAVAQGVQDSQLASASAVLDTVV